MVKAPLSLVVKKRVIGSIVVFSLLEHTKINQSFQSEFFFFFFLLTSETPRKELTSLLGRSPTFLGAQPPLREARLLDRMHF